MEGCFGFFSASYGNETAPKTSVIPTRLESLSVFKCKMALSSCEIYVQFWLSLFVFNTNKSELNNASLLRKT